MVRIGLGLYTLEWAMGSEAFGRQRLDAAAVEEIGPILTAEQVGVLAVYRAAFGKPVLVVAAAHAPWYEGHEINLGALLVPETDTLFVGAGDEVIAYDLRGPAQLWREEAEFGFWGWQRHGDYVVMAAELELAASGLQGVKQWKTFVEPPYDYTVSDGIVYLTVLDVPVSFPLSDGPEWGGSLPWRSP